MYVYLPNAKSYYAPIDRTINSLMKGNVDMNATTGEEYVEYVGGENRSDGEIREIAKKETEVEIFIVDKNKTRAGGSFFPYLNTTIFDLSKYVIFKKLIETITNMIVYTSL